MKTTKISQEHAEEMYRLLTDISLWWRHAKQPISAGALITADERPLGELVLEVLLAITDDNGR